MLSGPRDNDTETDGGVASYLNDEDVTPALTLPALSVHVPLTVVPPVSGPAYEPEEQVAIPDVPSVPATLKLTGLWYHPFESGPRAKATPVTLGGVASRFTVTGRLELDPLL